MYGLMECPRIVVLILAERETVEKVEGWTLV